MSAGEYSNPLRKEEPSYKGNEITKCCKDFLKGLLAKKIKKRLSIVEAINHNWILKIKDIVYNVQEKYKSDPEKMILIMNNYKLDDSVFENDKNSVGYVTTNTSENFDDNNLNDKILSKKRYRHPKI